MAEQLTAQQVYPVLLHVASTDENLRKPTEEQFRTWESSSTKGYLASLVDIISKGNEIHEQVRLLACIVAKNAVGSSWRKTLSTREWTKVDKEEKEYLRRILPELLLNEPNNQIALQIALLISNIVRFDFPNEWPDILDQLVATVTSTTSLEMKYRGVVALKYIFQALQTKITITSGYNMEAVQTAVKEARDMPRKVAQQFAPLADQCKLQLQEFAKATENWKFNAAIAIELLSVITNCIILVPHIELLEPQIQTFFEIILDCSKAQFQLLTKPYAPQYEEYYQLLAKCFFKNLNCVVCTFEKHTVKFCAFILPFVCHYSEVIATFPRSCNFFIPQKIVKITQFLIMVMVCPFFRHQFWHAMSTLVHRSTVKFDKGKMVYDGLNEFLTTERLHIIIESLIQNHLQLTPEEIEAWQNEPEIFMKDTEAPDSLRAAAEKLISAIYIRETSQIKEILILDVRKLQQHPNSDSDEIVMLLDSCYRAIGAGSTQSEQVVDINQWYDTELRARIENPEKCTLFRDRVLLHRGLWLIKKFAPRVCDENVDKIIASVLGCASHPDLVVAMQAIKTLHSFLLLRQSREEEEDTTLPIGVIVKQCFAVLPKLTETENRIHILELVSQLIRIVGYRTIEPHLEEIIGYLPALWTNLPTNEREESGGEIRLQKSLVTLTSNIIQAIGPSALENPRVGELALALLQFTTNPRGQQALNMLDEGLQLWNSILQATPTLAQVLVDLYPRLFEILKPEVEPEKGLPILKAYILLGPDRVATFIPQIVHAIDAIIGRCDYKESVFAANIIETLFLIFPDDTPKWFVDTLRRMTRDLVEGEAIERTKEDKKRLVPVEAIAITQVLARIVIREPIAFSALCSGNVSAQEKLLDQWLQCISNHSIEELFSSAAVIEGLHQRKTVSIALLQLIDKNHPVICDHAEKILRSIHSVVKENDKMAPKLVRLREQQMNAQLDRKFDICQQDLLLNDPIDSVDFNLLFQQAIAKYPITETESTIPFLPFMEVEGKDSLF